MGCPDFEDLLKKENQGHAAHCQECRALLDALAHVDATFESAFAHISAPPGMAAAVRLRTAQASPGRAPTWIPEVLDLIGWAAVLAIAAIVVPQFAALLRTVLDGLG